MTSIYKPFVLLSVSIGLILGLSTVTSAQSLDSIIRGAIEKKIREKQQREAAERAKPVGKENRRALVVSVGSSTAGLDPLPGIDADADRLADALVRGGFDRKNVQRLQAGAEDNPDQPRKDKILPLVQKLATSSSAKDLLLISFTGHGITLGGESYLCPVEATVDATVDEEVAKRELIAVNELVRLLSTAKARYKLLIIDACRNKSEANAGAATKELQGNHDGVWIISSCSRDEKAWVSPGIRTGESHAIFTHYFAEALNGDADLVSGNNDGRVSILEACTYSTERTQRAATALNEIQTPKLYFATNLFDIVEISNLLPERILRSGDPDVDRSHTAVLLGSQGNSVSQISEQHWRSEFRKQFKETGTVSDQAFRDQHLQLCYAFGNYLSPAIDLDPNCRPARLARGFCYRAAGNYSAALEELQKTDEPLTLFATGRLGSRKDLFLPEEGANIPFRDLEDKEILKLLSKINLYGEAVATSEVVGTVQSANHLTITKVVERDGEEGTEEWLFVTAVDGVGLAQGGWIHHSSVHWFPEAAELYLPDSPLNKESQLPTIIQNQRRVSEATAKNQKLMRDVQELRRAEATLNRLRNIGLPGVGIAAGVVATVRAALEMAALNGRRQFVQTYAEYQEAVEKAQWLTAQRRKLMQKRDLDPVRDTPVVLGSSPWQLAKNP